ncbi:aminotransferase class IV [Leisingera sp. F5]|uniref:aminotransferase class IV n=1 Tax=Leisingera sp. F5 TaxID=1813816 RepID=UPI000A64ACA1|nr:aminotransferase class IV [Leisingera sp. F5]
MRKLPELSHRHADHRSYPPGVAYMDGQYLPMHEAKLSVLDYGFLHSDATYDVAHVWEGAFFRLEDHLNRFFRGMDALHMSVPYGKAQVTEILHNCVALSGLRQAYVEFICTRGTSPDFSRDPRQAENRFIAFAIPFGSVASEEQMQHGLHMAVTDVQRIPPGSVDPTVKNYHWLDMVKGLYAAYGRGADTALLVDGNGNISEGPGFNVFAIKDGAAATPDTSVLLGVTRQTVFDICAQMGVPCSARNLAVEDLKKADEVFVTSTAGGVMPVTRIDGQPVGTGRTGPLFNRILAAYWQLHDSGEHRDPVMYPEPAGK